MLRPEFTGQFKRDYKLALKRGCDPCALQAVSPLVPSNEGAILPLITKRLQIGAVG